MMNMKLAINYINSCSSLTELSEYKVAVSPDECSNYPQLEQILIECSFNIALILDEYIVKIQSASTYDDVFSAMVREAVVENIYKVRNLADAIRCNMPGTTDEWWSLYNPEYWK